MNKNLLKLKFLALGLCLATNVSAQETCGTDHFNQQLLRANPSLSQILEESNLKIANTLRNGNFNFRNQQEIYEIPTVVYIVVDDSPLGEPGNPTDAQIYEKIAETNKHFANTMFPGQNSAKMPFKLVLAKRTPNNEATNGIVRITQFSNDQRYLTYGMQDEESNGYSTGELLDDIWDTNSYYKLVIVNTFDGGNSSAGAFANYPDYARGNELDGSYFRSTSFIPTTIAHEVGHGLGLAHVFGDTTGAEGGTNCIATIADDPLTTGDYVADTAPTITGSSYFEKYGVYKPTSAIINSCTNLPFDDIVSNILNYGWGGPNGRSMFTQGQADRSVLKFLEFRSSFLTSLATTAPSTTSNIPVATTTPCVSMGRTDFAHSQNSNVAYRNGVGIEKIVMGSISNNTPSAQTNLPVYTDYSKSSNINSAYTTNLSKGENIDITLGTTGLYGGGGRAVKISYKVFIDFNNNGQFEENESVSGNQTIDLNNTIQGEYKEITYSFSVPETAVVDTPLRMRVIGDWNDTWFNDVADFSPCADRLVGEVEDYTVIVKEATSTVWNGTSWSAGLPTPTKEGIVRGDLVLNELVRTNKFTLESGSVTLNNQMVVNEVINNLTADKFVINSAGLYQQNPTDKAIGEFTVIQNSTPMILNDATLWSSPVKNQNVRSFSPQTLLKRFYKYDEANNKFSSLFVNDPLYPNPTLSDPFTYNFEPAIGYHIRVAANQNSTVASPFVGKFVGELNTGIITVPATVNSFGYNLVGNPYPSVISADSFLQTNPNVESLYFWTQEAPLTSEGYANNNYASYTLAGGVKAAAGGVAPNKNISKGQGFFVEMAVPTNITFNNYMRANSGEGLIMHRTEEDVTKRVKLDLFEGTQAKNQILISYMDNATNAFDQQIDGKLNRMYTGSSLYSLIENDENQFVIQGRDAANFENDVVKLGFEAKAAAVYTIKIADLENLDNQNIYLIDNVDNQIVDLTVSDYNFNSEIGTFNERFEIVYVARSLSTIDSTISKDNVKAVKVSNGIKIVSSQEIKNIEVYDVLGRKISSTNSTGKSEVMLSNISKSNQVIIIKVTSVDGTTSNVKVVY